MKSVCPSPFLIVSYVLISLSPQSSLTYPGLCGQTTVLCCQSLLPIKPTFVDVITKSPYPTRFLLSFRPSSPTFISNKAIHFNFLLGLQMQQIKLSLSHSISFYQIYISEFLVCHIMGNRSLDIFIATSADLVHI